jgi:hypothetical protein
MYGTCDEMPFEHEQHGSGVPVPVTASVLLEDCCVGGSLALEVAVVIVPDGTPDCEPGVGL